MTETKSIEAGERTTTEKYECVFTPDVDSRRCYQCGKTREQHDGKQNLFDYICEVCGVQSEPCAEIAAKYNHAIAKAEGR